MAAGGSKLLSAGFALIGQRRAEPYRKVGDGVARGVAACWIVPPDVTREVSDPLAAILDRYLPEPAKRAAEVGMEPAEVLLGMWSILRQCQANERVVLGHFLASRATDTERPETPAEPETATVADPGAAVEQSASFDVIGAAA